MAIFLKEREIESILCLSNGYIGTRNSLEEGYPECDPASFIGDFYVKAPEDEYNFLVTIPDWTRIQVYLEGDLLDLRNQEVINNFRYIDFNIGSVIREWRNQDEQGRLTNIKIIKFVSLEQKNICGKQIIIKPENYSGNIKVVTGIDCNTVDFSYLLNMGKEPDDYAFVYMKARHSDRELKMYHKSIMDSQSNYFIEILHSGSFENFGWFAELGSMYTINSLCSINVPAEYAFDLSFSNHISKWQQRWRDSRIIIKGSEYDQKLIDFATYHLINSGEFSGNSHSVPARNLSGEAYKGHVFWDTEMYLLPFYILTNPKVARALLMYRYNTLDGARQNASKEGFKGASYAWESTDTGLEAAPESAILPDGKIIYILSGRYENHISSDIAYSVWKYWQATGDDDFLKNYGSEIIFETARFCESMLSRGADGLFHINKVIGPDEYHEIVDDNAYTNYLVKHNFEIAVRTRHILGLQDDETKKWQEYSENIYSGHDPDTMLYEQFKGYYDLEYIDLKDFEPRSVPMDVILGREKTNQTQVIKQADVLMLLFLFLESFSKMELKANYNFYEPRCGHGSSLSPSIHSIIAARAGNKNDAYRYFLKNAHIDIGNEFGNASGGVHIASLGGVWMSVVFGFAGLTYDETGFNLDFNLPEEWDGIEFSIKWKGERKDIKIDKKGIITS